MGVKGLTPGRENSLGGDHMVFRGNEGGIGCCTAEHKGGGAYGKLREESQKYYGALRREKVNFKMTGPISRHGCVVKKGIGKRNLCSVILQTLVKISKTRRFFSVAKCSDTS